MAIAPQVARVMARELGRSAAWEAGQVKEFQAIAPNYFVKPQAPVTV